MSSSKSRVDDLPALDLDKLDQAPQPPAYRLQHRGGYVLPKLVGLHFVDQLDSSATIGMFEPVRAGWQSR